MRDAFCGAFLGGVPRLAVGYPVSIGHQFDSLPATLVRHESRLRSTSLWGKNQHCSVRAISHRDRMRKQETAVLTDWKDWSGREDSNLRPPAPKAGALPGCATPRLSETLFYRSLH